MEPFVTFIFILEVILLVFILRYVFEDDNCEDFVTFDSNLSKLFSLLDPERILENLFYF